MEAALDCLKQITWTENLFGFEENYKRAKIEKLQERYADLMSDLLRIMNFLDLPTQLANYTT